MKRAGRLLLFLSVVVLLAGCTSAADVTPPLQPTTGHLLAIFLVRTPLMLLFPLVLGWYIKRRFGVGWAVFGWGALTFILSQAVHIPLNALLNRIGGGMATWPFVLTVLVLGFSAGICEEGARWLMLRFAVRKVRGWRAGLQFGAGHGGIEAIITGLLALLGTINIIVASSMDLSAAGLTPAMLEQVRLAQAQAWGAPPYLYILAGFERVFAIIMHIALASLVMVAVVRSRVGYLLAAILLHALANAAAVWVAQQVSPAASEGVMVFVTALSLWIIWKLRENPPPAVALEVSTSLAAPSAADLAPRELSDEEIARRVDASRFE